MGQVQAGVGPSGELRLPGPIAGQGGGSAGQRRGEGCGGTQRGGQAEPGTGGRGGGESGVDARAAVGVWGADSVGRGGGPAGSDSVTSNAPERGASVILRGRDKRRGADAAEQASEDDAGATGPQEALLEPAPVPDRPAQEDQPLPAPG